MSDVATSSAEFFEEKYRAANGNDPWSFATSDYELGRYAAVLRALSGRTYLRAFEPGCSVGVLTAQLSAVCGAVDACDFSPTAAAVARARCAQLPNVSVQCSALDADQVWQPYDLVILCEIGYYFSAEPWRALVSRMAEELRPGATVLLCHWLGASRDHKHGSGAVHDAVKHPLLQLTLSERHGQDERGFLLERWTRI